MFVSGGCFFGTIYELVLGIIPGILFLKSNTYNAKKVSLFNKMTDEEIVSSYKNGGGQQLIGVLFDRYIHLVFASCMKYLKDEEDAQDAAMEIFESLPEKLRKHSVENFKSWLYTTTKNACLMHLRKQKPVDRLEKVENFPLLSVENESFLHLNNKDDEEQVLLKQFLLELKEEQRTCIEMMYLKGKSYKEIALETGFDQKNVKSYIQNGKRNLKQKLEKHYEDHGEK